MATYQLQRPIDYRLANRLNPKMLRFRRPLRGCGSSAQADGQRGAEDRDIENLIRDRFDL